MSRMKFPVGAEVILLNNPSMPYPLRVINVQPALEKPYFLANNEWYDEDEIEPYVPPARTLEELEADVKGVATQLRNLFDEKDASSIYAMITIDGRVHGDLKIEYTVGEREYDSNKVRGYSLVEGIKEMFRRKGWTKRNEPTMLTYTGEEKKESESF